MPAAAFLSAVLGIGLCGCQSEPKQYAANPPQGGTSGEVTVERDDLDAALSYLQGRFELAVVETTDFPNGDVMYRLVSVIDEPVWITLRLPSDAENTPLEGSATVRYGRFGDPEREQAILRELRDRLRWLESRD